MVAITIGRFWVALCVFTDIKLSYIDLYVGRGSGLPATSVTKNPDSRAWLVLASVYTLSRPPVDLLVLFPLE